MFRSKNALDATHYKPPNYLLNKLAKMVENLEQIERALELYLESKRQLFPRFYFISNDEMLEVYLVDNARKNSFNVFDSIDFGQRQKTGLHSAAYAEII